MSWLSRAKENLLPLSSEKYDFSKAKKEWEYSGFEDTNDAGSICELCDHDHIRYEYLITNKITSEEMIVGSSCIYQFIYQFEKDHDTFFDGDSNPVTVNRVKADKQNYLKNILIDKLKSDFYNKGFEISITDKIEQDGKLTVNQAKYLNVFYYKLSDIYQTAFREVVSVQLRSKRDKEQLDDLKSMKSKGSSLARFEFVKKLLTPQQKAANGL